MNLSLQFLQNTAPYLAFKLGFLIIVLFVVIFLLVVLNQTRAMNRILTQQDLFPYLLIFTFLLLGATIALFIAGVVIL